MNLPVAKRLAGTCLLAALSLLLGACDKHDDAKAATSAAAPAADAQTVLRVGTSGAYPPFESRDAQGQLVGYDVDVLNAVGSKLNYRIEWTTAEFSGLFGMLDTHRIDTVANLISVTPAREKKYLFSTPYAYDGAQLVVKNGSPLKTLEDLKGKTLGAMLGSDLQQYASNWDSEHGNPYTLKTYQDNSGVYDDVANGRLDAFIDSEITALVQIKAKNLPLKIANDTKLYSIKQSFPFRNTPTDQAFANRFNQALDELAKDGTLSKISQKWLGKDVTHA
ncbi:transporter substrate-binding domain-containing protein [Pseudomonas sp. dw_358]|uniref:transporter substrate-binding domain-containing protein n=1 Tax=Pseudomonas sp. dw_358 TaxID=2720083 RepID=UPI001BD30673|nr:transporter substrate-binding domain-containing protein [Pseudomonas sp. dw_358]